MFTLQVKLFLVSFSHSRRRLYVEIYFSVEDQKKNYRSTNYDDIFGRLFFSINNDDFYYGSDLICTWVNYIINVLLLPESRSLRRIRLSRIPLFKSAKRRVRGFLPSWYTCRRCWSLSNDTSSQDNGADRSNLPKISITPIICILKIFLHLITHTIYLLDVSF